MTKRKGIKVHKKFVEGLVFWLLNRLPGWMVADYATEYMEMYDLDTAREILADQGSMKGDCYG